MQIDSSLLLALEERAFNAWPARRTVLCDGWLFRLSDGFTKRANSVNAGRPGLAFAGVHEAAEAVYTRHGLPLVFRLSPMAPPEADEALEQAGYRFFDPSRVATSSLANAAASTSVDVADAPTQTWLDGFASANGVAPDKHAVHHAMVRSIALPCGFASMCEDGVAIGFALAVLERGAVGFYDVVIAPGKRGGGRGRTLMRALMQWGVEQGAAMGYLQVRDENTAARSLYAGLGFEDAYGYHYRVPAG